jgi:hypothetical protein
MWYYKVEATSGHRRYPYETGFPYTWATNICYDPGRNPLELKSSIGHTTALAAASGQQLPPQLPLDAAYSVLRNANLDPRNASFGYTNQDRNKPRDVQLAVRLTF